MQTKILYIFLIAIPIFITCDDTATEIIPDVPVNIEFSLNEPAYSNLNVVMGVVKVQGYGYRGNGVIVFRQSENEIVAFDATCPNHITENTSVNIDAIGSGTATCPHCGRVYFLVNYGYPKDGYPLKQYRVIWNGNFVRVYN